MTWSEPFTSTFTVVFPQGRDCVAWGNSTSRPNAIDVTGQRNTFSHCVQANRDANLQGSNNRFNETVRYVRNLNAAPSNVLVNGSLQVTASPYPYLFRLEDYQPGGRAAQEAAARGEYWTHTNNAVLTAATLVRGLHYVNGHATVDVTGVARNVTIVAKGALTLTATSSTLDAYADGLLLGSWTGGADRLNLRGDRSRFVGALFAHQSETQVATTNSLLRLSLIHI